MTDFTEKPADETAADRTPLGVCAGTIVLYEPDDAVNLKAPTLLALEVAIKAAIRAELGLDASVVLTWTSK